MASVSNTLDSPAARFTPVPDEHPELSIPPAPPTPRTRWRRAWRSLRELIANSDDTAKAMDVFYAIGRGEFEHEFQRFAADPSGRKLLAERSSLRAALCDREALSRMPEGSLGRSYLAYLDRNGFEADGLVKLQDQVQASWEREEDIPPLDPLRAWYRERMMLTHDLFHLMTDYGTDDVGEATLLVFAQAQRGGRANGLLTFGACVELALRMGRPWLAYVVAVWRRGRRTPWLATVPYEEVLSLPLETVKRMARVVPPARAHPGGILRQAPA